jgi:hypothetical protein
VTQLLLMILGQVQNDGLVVGVLALNMSKVKPIVYLQNKSGKVFILQVL